MNAQERELLTAFLQQLSQAQAVQKDTDAETLIKAACARQPDSAYLLVQRAMQLDYALQATQAESARLQAELDQFRSSAPTGFLASPNAWGRGTPAPQAASTAAVGQPRAPSAPAAPARGSAWGSGMLGTVASTAAGVVAGSFLFQGIQGLMGQRDAGAQPGPSAGTQPSHPPAETTAASDQHHVNPSDESTDFADAGDGDLGDLA